MKESVKVTKQDVDDARKIENDYKKILALIDLMFLFEDKQKILPS